MDDRFWTMVIAAAGIATAIATAAAALMAAWWRRQDRQEADWAVFGEHTGRQDAEDVYGTPAYLALDASLANAGDGAAFRLVAEGRRGCSVRLQGEHLQSGPTRIGGRSTLPVVPVMVSGDQVHLRVDVEAPERWDEAEIVLSWIRSPTWKKRRSRRETVLRLADLAPLPEDKE